MRDKTNAALGEVGRIDYVIGGSPAYYHHTLSDGFRTVIDVDTRAMVNMVTKCLSQLIVKRGSVVLLSPSVHRYEAPFTTHSIRQMEDFKDKLFSVEVNSSFIVGKSYQSSRAIHADNELELLILELISNATTFPETMARYLIELAETLKALKV